MGLLIRDIVNDATRSSHRRLDLALSWLDLRQPQYYQGFLRGQAEALIPLETALERHGISQIVTDWTERTRTAALQRDLAVLDVACDPLPQPTFTGAAEMLGAVYVLEASRMGARIVLARLAQHPQSSAIGATSYLRHGFGRRFWPTFLTLLENHPAAQSNTADVVLGAETAYGMFESALIPVASVAAE